MNPKVEGHSARLISGVRLQDTGCGKCSTAALRWLSQYFKTETLGRITCVEIITNDLVSKRARQWLVYASPLQQYR